VRIKSSEINKTKATFVNVLFNYGTSIVLIINSIVLVPFYLNYMSLSDYGAWLTAIATINIIMLIDPGISSVCSQRLSKHFNDDSDKEFQGTFFSSLLMAGFFMIITLCFGLIIASFVPDLINYENNKQLEKLEIAMQLYIVSICLVPVYSILSSFLQSLLQTFKDNVINFLSIITSPFVIVISLINDLGIISLALGILFPNFLRVLLYLVTVIVLWGRYLKESLITFSNLGFLSLFKDIKFLYLRKFSSITSENIETAVAGILFSTEIAAFLSILKRIFVAIQMFSTGIATSTYTSLSHVFSGLERDRLREAIKNIIYSFQLIHLFGTSIILASLGPLIFLWLEEKLIFDYSFVLLMALNVFLVAKLNLLYSILYTSGNFKSVAYISIGESITRLTLTYWLVSNLDIFGLPLAGIISSLIALFYIAKLIQEKTGDYIYKIFYPGSGYELTIYLSALFIGFYNVAKDNVFSNTVSILLATFLLFLLIIFSKRVRDLGRLIFKAIK
jgi:O-antigen/teichoic acid export membrane protein